MVNQNRQELPPRMETPDPQSESADYYAVRTEADAGIRMHWHNFYEFVFVYDGQCSQILNGVKRACAKGTLTVLSSSDFHAYDVDKSKGESISALSVHFHEFFPDENTLNILGSLCGKQIDCSNEEFYGKICRELSEIFEECENKRNERDSIVRSAVSKIAIYAFRAYGSECGKTEKQMSVYPEIQYIEKHFRMQITEGEIAAVAGFSTAYFSKIFKRRYGISFQSYLLNKRLQYAYGLISSSSASLTRICMESGFNSYSYFCRSFKKRYGITPNDLRARCLGTTSFSKNTFER